MATSPSPRTLSLLAIPVVLSFCWHRLHGEPAPVQPLPDRRFIDLHCHAAGLGAHGSGCFVSDALQRSFRFNHYLRAFGTSPAELRSCGDGIIIERISAEVSASNRVGRAVVLALDGRIAADGQLDRARTEAYVPNEFVAAHVAKHANLLFGASVNPYRRDALQRIEWAKAHGAVLMKWLPSVQGIDPADPALIPFYQKLVALRLPLLSHTGTEHSFTAVDDALGDPARLRLPLEQGVTVIAAHAATTGTYAGEPARERLARLLRAYPHLYADISALTQVNKLGHLEHILHRPEFKGRLLYGTDFPLTAMRVLVSPRYYPLRLRRSDRRRIAAIENSWDRDVALKQALGVPTDVWTRAETVLRLA